MWYQEVWGTNPDRATRVGVPGAPRPRTQRRRRGIISLSTNRRNHRARSGGLSLSRRFKLSERVTLQFRADSTNLTNTPRFDNPRTDASGTGLGEITNAWGEREIRLGLRIGF
ncbi:MAG: hypothetical protein Q8N47_04175 [Bryobacterales bacterium]|nr:hypothetical protein [Bryobacterales bacterium]